jgi:arylsulfatase A-like enzyme
VGLGGGPQADLLALGLSATDVVGHFYGPESWESRDSLARLDAALGHFLSFLETRLGVGQLLVVVSADHGVLPIPEWLQETGRSHCPLPGGRLPEKQLFEGLAEHLDTRFGGPRKGDAAWFAAESDRLTLNRRRAARAGVSAEALLAAAREHLESVEGVVRVWARDEVLAGGGLEPFATLYRNSWDPRIGGDLAIQVEEDCLLSDGRLATSHGSPYEYDRRVPLVFFGPGVEPGRVGGDAATVDVAPTLAHLLGIEAPADLDGRVLPMR